MNSEKNYKDAGYEKGFEDGRVTRGKINKKYLECLLKSKTQDLSNQESLLYKNGWQDGFADAIRGAIQNMVVEGDLIKEHIDKIYGIGNQTSE